jgi:hypothetical protein
LFGAITIVSAAFHPWFDLATEISAAITALLLIGAAVRYGID